MSSVVPKVRARDALAAMEEFRQLDARMANAVHSGL
jgi:hypothetical protein